MKITSKIKSMFSEELLRYISAICDNKRIPSNNRKMVILGDLLHTYGVEFEILGGATNRIALQIDGYAVKFALDEQGFQDNFIEYSLSPELQPFVTKSYETNGYIQVQELVELMSKSAFSVYKIEIYKVLDMMSRDYLLGDVGYLEKNRSNWGVRDGKPVILDYAYCHRSTENLFTCEKCGQPLTPDAVYDKYLCTDRSGCKASYTYNERKRVQGNQVDIDMINERKNDSIKIVEGELFKEIDTFDNRLVGEDYFIINTRSDLERYEQLKEELEMRNRDINRQFDAIVEYAMSGCTDEKAKAIIDGKYDDDEEYEKIPEPLYTDNYYENYYEREGIGIPVYFISDKYDEYSEDYDENYSYDYYDSNDEVDMDAQFDAIVNKAMAMRNGDDEGYLEPEDFDEEFKEYYDSYNIPETIDISPEPEPEQEPERVIVEEVKEEIKELNDYKISAPASNIDAPTIFLNGEPIPIGQEVEICQP